MKNFFNYYLRFSLLLLSLIKSNGENLRSRPFISNESSSEEELIAELSERMKPRNFFAEADANFTENGGNIPPKQFFHLHHMKSGGTSTNSFLNCGLSRAQRYYSSHYGRHDVIEPLRLSRGSVSECAYSSFTRCMTNPEDRCRTTIPNNAYVTYCAPLFATNMLGWQDADAVTMLRHPVDRVWSMFRFQTKSCFKCTDLKEVYRVMDNMGTNASGTVFGGGICLAQLTNHLTRNLQSKVDNDDWNYRGEDDMRLADAVENVQNRFVVVGLLERLDETVQMLSHSFPWLSPILEDTGSNTSEAPPRECNFPRVNSSPNNNRCGENGGHWDLPSTPDEETRQSIIDHNQLDMQLYEVALQQFELQLRVVQRNTDNE